MKNRFKLFLHPNLGVFLLAFFIAIISHHAAKRELIASDMQYNSISDFSRNFGGSLLLKEDVIIYNREDIDF